MIVCCTLSGKDETGKARCIYIRSTEEPGAVEITTLDGNGVTETSWTIDGKDLIKAIENAMNV